MEIGHIHAQQAFKTIHMSPLQWAFQRKNCQLYKTYRIVRRSFQVILSMFSDDSWILFYAFQLLLFLLIFFCNVKSLN